MIPPRGLTAYPITPMDRTGRVDATALRMLIARLVAARVDGIGLLGSTGSYMYLTREERRRALEAALSEADGLPVLAGVGALRTDEAIRLAQDAKAIGVTAGLLAAVSYTPLTEDEVFGHFSTVAREGGLPIILYDNPGTTHFRFTPDLLHRLSRVPGILGVKNPTTDAAETRRTLEEQRGFAPPGFSIGFSGDWNATEAMIAGADAWHSVLAGLMPRACLEITRAAARGDADEARRLDATLAPLWDMFRQHSSLRVVHTLADMLGICRAEPPRPILPLPEAIRRQLAETLAHLPKDILL
ncbi:dihydrodipicolinate synthase family protein [Paenirhodobacter sp.]|uniref:dihydrodipicolinate synthase family protein n=1 Tax=Paenirhodobacter sp. TaxID=1965326 RepID=UPI003B3C7C8E